MKLSSIKEQALHLPVDERASLARRLLESLDELPAKEAEQLWAEEAGRRAAEIDSGDVGPVSAEELERRVQARIE